MKDQSKTKQALIRELSFLRQRIAELEQSKSERKRVEEALHAANVYNRILIEASLDPLVTIGADGKITDVNAATETVTGYTRTELIGTEFSDYFTEPEQARAGYQEVFRAGSVRDHPLELRHRDGHVTSVLYNASVYRDEQGRIEGVFAAARDITERKRAEEEIRQMAYHDHLTGLPNRKLFFDRLGVTLTQAQRNQREVGIAMLDLDNFKEVNDALGHDRGDFVLKKATERLLDTLRKGDTIARFGGDEFVLILPELRGADDAVRVAEKLVDAFRKPFLINDREIMITTSVGIAIYPGDGDSMDMDALIKNADIAMYQAKQTGRNRYHCYKA